MQDQSSKPYSSKQVREWLVLYMARLFRIEVDQVDAAKSFELQGLDSSGAVGLSGDLSELLGVEFDPTLAYDYPSIDALVGHLQEAGHVAQG